MLIVSGFAALIVIIVFLLYMVIDAGVSLTYSRVSNEYEVASNKKLSALVLSEWGNLTEEQVLTKLRTIEANKSLNEQAFVKREKDEGLIWYGAIQFEFVEGKLVSIK